MRDSVPRHRYLRRGFERRLLLPVPRSPAAGRGAAHADAADLVWRCGRRGQHDAHPLRGGGGSARVGTSDQSEHPQLHRRPGQRPGRRAGLERDHAQRRLRAVCASEPDIRRVLRPRQCECLYKRSNVGEWRRHVQRRRQLRLDQRHLRRRLRAFRSHDDRVRRSHDRVPFGRQRRNQLQPVRGRGRRTAGASAFFDACA